jgi:serine/threonine protein phosphatase 1
MTSIHKTPGSTTTPFPGSDRLFAIGDIHGCALELRLLLNELPLTPDSKVVFLGDYVDRGPDSKGVIETILELKQRVSVIALAGNHEEMFLSFLDDPESEMAGMFIFNGGGSTLASFGSGDGKYTLSQQHFQFLNDLKIAHSEGDYFFVHAGVPEKVLSLLDLDKDMHDLLWIREPFLSSDFAWEKTIVHGHTPRKHVEIAPRRINLDTGCVYGRRLSAIALPSQTVFSVPKQEKAFRVYLKDPDSSRIAVRFRGKIPVTILKNQRTFEFETLDYNEFGILVRELSGEPIAHFSLHEGVQGWIGSSDRNRAPFLGKIVRISAPSSQKDSHFTYAIQMDQPVVADPKDSS